MSWLHDEHTVKSPPTGKNWKRLFRILILSLLGWLTLTIFGPCTADSVRNSYHPHKMESGARAWGLKTAHFAQGTVYMISIFRSYEPNHDPRCH